MSIDEEKIKMNAKSSDDNLSQVNFKEDNLLEDTEVNYDFNEEIIISNNEHNIMKSEDKNQVKKEEVIKNPRSPKKKKVVEYIEDGD